jgi:hypothetical protein
MKAHTEKQSPQASSSAPCGLKITASQRIGTLTNGVGEGVYGQGLMVSITSIVESIIRNHFAVT